MGDDVSGLIRGGQCRIPGFWGLLSMNEVVAFLACFVQDSHAENCCLDCSGCTPPSWLISHSDTHHPWITRCCCQPPAMFQQLQLSQHNLQHQHQQLCMQQQQQQGQHPRPAAGARVAPRPHAMRMAAVKADWRDKGGFHAMLARTHTPRPSPHHNSCLHACSQANTAGQHLPCAGVLLPLRPV